MKPFVSVVIPAHNEEKFIADCLDALSKQDYPPDRYEIIVVDNNSTDGTAKISRKFHRVKYLFKKEGPVGSVRNWGVKNSSGELIAFLDADCVVKSNWLSTGVDLLAGKEHTHAIGGKYEVPSNAKWIEKYWLLGNKNRVSYNLDLLGGCIILSKKAFNDAGLFDENITSGEDSKLSSTLRSLHYHVEINQQFNVIHLGNAKTINDFVKRQIWHSENYIKEIRSSICDPTFWLILTFIFLLFASVSFIIIGEFSPSIISALLAFALPNILSAKRIIRSSSPWMALKNYHKVYFVDLIYLIGRMIGILKGLNKKALKP